MSSEFGTVYEEAVFGTEQLFKSFTDTQINKFLLALCSVVVVANKPVDKLNLRLGIDAANRLGKFSEHNLRELLVRQSKFKSPPINVAKRTVRDLRDVGGSWVKTGHYRRITIPQILELMQAGQANCYSVLLIESGKRTEQFKQKNNELSDLQRIHMFELSGLVTGGVYIIEGQKYDNQFYTRLIRDWSPSFYLGNENWPDWLKDQAKYRGGRRTQFVELANYVPAISTTRMERMIKLDII